MDTPEAIPVPPPAEAPAAPGSGVARAIKDTITEADGESFDSVKVLGMALVIVFIGLSIASFVLSRPFDAMAYGTASGLVIGALGAAIRMTEKPNPGGAP